MNTIGIAVVSAFANDCICGTANDRNFFPNKVARNCWQLIDIGGITMIDDHIALINEPASLKPRINAP